MKAARNSKLKEVEDALLRMPATAKKVEAAYFEELRFSKQLFGPVLKEILKYRLAK